MVIVEKNGKKAIIEVNRKTLAPLGDERNPYMYVDAITSGDEELVDEIKPIMTKIWIEYKHFRGHPEEFFYRELGHVKGLDLTFKPDAEYAKYIY